MYKLLHGQWYVYAATKPRVASDERKLLPVPLCDTNLQSLIWGPLYYTSPLASRYGNQPID